MNTSSSRVLRLKQVQEMTGLGRDSVYRLARTSDFPRPVKIGLSASGWLESEVIAYIERCAARRAAAKHVA